MLIFGGSLLVVLAYLLGSIPFGLVLTRLFTSIDIRRTGSGNIGATNVRRLAGNLLGFLTLLGDVLKGTLPVLLTMALFRGEPRELAETLTACVAVAAFVGHLFPVYLGFKTGGKGVATALGGCLVLSPPAVLIFLVAFVVMVKTVRRVSVGSLTGAAVLVPAVGLFTGSVPYTSGCLMMVLFIFIKHRDNLKRILAGTEPTIDQKSDKKQADS
ncbi:MAG: Acyl-phosphate:glycerol-3-phosphate O-acyltransferase PlsY (EC 2.3.1.n3) [Olavius algarvensis Delta 4 endosymbiont]|nr:MAG: Acyl-phosphate:glycerol-3-phosphate O-acyltransferase PlsY (EC 2.3.1.n3) [Olavius algarvensis Delta 4 endosymbiont]